MSEFQPKIELNDRKAAWKNREAGVREKLGDLRQNIEVARKNFADALSEMANEISNSDTVPQKKLTEIIEKYSDGLDKDTEELFYDGVGAYMIRRRKLKHHLSRVGVEGVLEDLMFDVLGVAKPETERTPALTQFLRVAAERTVVEIGPVNYNIFIKQEDFKKLIASDKSGDYYESMGGYAKTNVELPYSVIFTNRTPQDEAKELIHKIFSWGEEDGAYHSDKEQKVMAHENEHQIEAFIAHIRPAEKKDLYKAVAWRKNRIKKLHELHAPEILMKRERGLLLESLKMIPGMAEINSVEEVPERFWQRLERRKRVDRSVQDKIIEEMSGNIKSEILAYTASEGSTDKMIRTILYKKYLPKYAQYLEENSDMEDTSAVFKRWQEQIDDALNTIEELKSLGNTAGQVVAMLTPVELSEWRGVARRQRMVKELVR
ncbi:MAG: hypothetical protein LBQ02_04720 [Candidatus Nomurabacteria bacterium]|jgi:hypothetical protein|nr:hypothetical protein [Candidatus Nomurabacteria bacterium]